ncbi:hypothetical protein FB45DRAFT_902722 [Roridomyces roridus]|uniref:Extracellular membrane protein CFEM domain-containing protein n=1 Tax=Roridomyces roridus TaxID=1738132 RepID=A0AAD7FQX3_9AGAR|nr:hypothetical protein FB45DRAFT_902722 [Roridomyces roridus]
MFFPSWVVLGIAGAVAAIPRLHFRSLPDIPTSCQTVCTPFVPFLSGNSCAVAECCLPIFQLGYFDCFGCVGNATHVTDYTLAQEYVDVLTTSCLSQNISLPVLTLPGQNPDRTLATALPPGASSLPIFGPAPSSTSGTATSRPSQSSSAAISPASQPSGTATFPASQSSGTATSPSSRSSGVSAAPSLSQTTITAPPSSASAAGPSTSAPGNGARALHFDHVAGFVAFVAIVLFA